MNLKNDTSYNNDDLSLIKQDLRSMFRVFTGAVMEASAMKFLQAKPCIFLPQHTNQLQNQFRCYTNYDSQLLNET